MTNRLMMITVTLAWLFMNGMLFAGYDYKWSQRMELSLADWAALALVNLTLWGFLVCVAQQTRSSVRERFLIREERCYDLEDVTVSACCLPCTIGQMYRHSANYDVYEGVCCSKNGLPDGVTLATETGKKQPPTSDYIV